MSKTLLTLIIAMLLLSSCSILKPNHIPEYTNDENKVEQMITHQPIQMPGDTTRNIIVYNVVEQEQKKTKLSDETLRMLIGDFFGTITTIITVWQMQVQNNQP